jgi:hypothetical protein
MGMMEGGMTNIISKEKAAEAAKAAEIAKSQEGSGGETSLQRLKRLANMKPWNER